MILNKPRRPRIVLTIADSSLLPRIGTILVGAPIVLATLWVGGPVWLFFVLLVAAALGWELERVTARRPNAGLPDRQHARGGWEGAIWAALATYVVGRYGITGAGLTAIGITVYTGFRELLFFHQRPLGRMLALTWSTLYVGVLWGSLILLRETGGFYWVLWAIVITWSSDISAYLVGHCLGRHKLAPELSPGKSWEGMVAGLVGGGAVALLLGMPLGFSPPVRLGLGLATALAAVLGDLWESALKREAGVKDASLILPGHGGFLDRMDSLLVAGAFTLILAWVHGVL